MNVVLMTMDRPYSLDDHIITMKELEHRDKLWEPTENSSLHFSVVNILRPDFGRAAILSKSGLKQSYLAKVKSLSNQSPISISRDISPITTASSCMLLSPPTSLDSAISIINAAHRQPHDSFSSHCDLSSPINRQSSSLSRSGSLESLASNRSSVAGGSINSSSSQSSSSSSSSSSVLTTCFENSSNENSSSNISSQNSKNKQSLWPAWIYCTRYSDRPSSGPRTRRIKRVNNDKSSGISEEKRPRTAFSIEQLARLRHEFSENRYLTEPRRQKLSKELGLHEQQIKIWFQNKRAKIKKASGQKNPLALQLMAQGLYNHSTVPVDKDGEELRAGHE